MVIKFAIPILCSVVMTMVACDDSSGNGVGSNLEENSEIEHNQDKKNSDGTKGRHDGRQLEESEELGNSSDSGDSLDGFDNRVESSDGGVETTDDGVESSNDSSSSQDESLEGEQDSSSSFTTSSESSGKKKCKNQLYDPLKQICDTRDGQVYNFVTITNEEKKYSETWMAQNLNYASANSVCYKNDSTNCTIYGRLYTWAAAVDKTEDECGFGHECTNSHACAYDSPTADLCIVFYKGVKGICPDGWHLPNYDDWYYLFDAVGGIEKAGLHLKSKTGWYSYMGLGNGKDLYGFSALPGGTGGTSYWEYLQHKATFWSLMEKYGSEGYVAYSVDLSFDTDYAKLDTDSKNRLRSVRCLKD
jgi:uncharacterized protein (TIGR02145 family)